MSIGKYVKGDTIPWEVTLDVDVTGWKIRCEVYDSEGNSVQLANTLAGGSDDQILVTSATLSESVIDITVAKGLTDDFCSNPDDIAYIEIEVETDDVITQKFTVLKDTIEFEDQKIDWDTPS